MRIDTAQRDVESFGMMEVVEATIKASPKVFDMFENSTYANKPAAILRELVANGIDAHKAAGTPERAVEVHLPTQLDPTCRVKDYGIGMSHVFMVGDKAAGIESKFMAYTDGSTKDGDDNAIGGFGIGSKSPFSLVDQYGIRSVHDGVLTVYTMFKNSRNMPAIGTQAQTTTDEPNGVEISFPVEADDVLKFAEAAQQALQYFRPIPEIVNGSVTPPDYTYEGATWGLRPQAGDLGIVMGGIRYPTIAANFAHELRTDAKLKPLLAYGIDLIMPIGAVPLAMSREQLSYTEKTSRVVRAALEGMVDEVVATFSTMFDNCASLWDAQVLLAKETGTDQYGMNARAQLLTSNAVYRGEKLEKSFSVRQTPGTKNWQLKAWDVEPIRNRRGKNVPKTNWVELTNLYGITPGSIETLIIDDLPQSPKSKTVGKLKEFIGDQLQNQKTLVVRSIGDHTVDDILAVLHNPTDYVLTSSMPEPVTATVARAKSIRPRVRMFTYSGTNGYGRLTMGNIGIDEIAYPQQPASGIMVEMDSFSLPGDLHRKMSAGLIRWDELVFVNKGDAEKIRKTFRPFKDVFAERLKTALAQYPDLPARIALSKDVSLKPLFGLWEEIKHVALLTAAQKARPFGRAVAIYQQYVGPLTQDERRLAPFMTAKLPARINPSKLWESFKTEQADVYMLMDVLNLDKQDQRDFFLKQL